MTRPANNGLTREEKAQRVDAIESLMTRRLSQPGIVAWARREWAVGERQARDYIRAVRDRWAAEAGGDLGVDRQERRLHMRASLNDIYARAMARSEIVRDAAGNPFIDPTTGKPLVREVPELRTAVRAADALCRLDGLYQDRVALTGANGAPLPAPQINVMFLGRSREDLVAYARTGRWPEPIEATVLPPARLAG